MSLSPPDANAPHPPLDPVELAGQHPADAAAAIEALPLEQGAEMLAALPPASAGEALEHLPERNARELIDELSTGEAARVLSYMAVDDAADLLAALTPERRAALLASLPRDERRVLEALLRYDPESAGGVMSPEVTALRADLTIPEAIAGLRKAAAESEQVFYTYVVDEHERLLGVLSLRDLLLARAEQRVRDVMITGVVSVPVDMDREEVAARLHKYGFLALPVVDAEQRLLGIVTVDDVVDIVQKEATEDMQRMVGAGADERIDSPVALVLRRRVYWLAINLATAFLAAAVIGRFEAALTQISVLAVLMPIVAGQAGNTGLQSMAVMIRALATGEARTIPLLRIMLREVWIGAGAGLLIGLVCGLATWGWIALRPGSDPTVALVIGIAMLACMTLATVSGALVPWIMQRCGFDPAQSASIILTTITDVAGFGVFLGLGSWMLLR